MKLRVTLSALLACAVAVSAPLTVRAQSTAEHIAAGDREKLDPSAALKHYEAVLATEPNNYDALQKAAGAAVDAGMLASDDKTRDALYKKAEGYARRAVAVNGADADGHFQLARAIGRTAQTMGSRDRVKYAAVIRDEALAALKINPKHDGALHVMGVWNAEVMRLSGIARFMAKNFLGGKIFDSASWNDAQHYLEQAVEIAPTRLVHRIDLAEVYLDRNNTAKAREQLDYVLRAPVTDALDPKFKREAEELQSKAR
jgi:hypothetical protein